MNRTSGIFVAIVVCSILAVGVFYLADQNVDKVYATPQEVFEASRAAIRNKDLRAWCQCLTDESRDILAAKPILFSFREAYQAAQTKEEKTFLKAMVEMQTKHGLTEEHLAKLEPEAMAMRPDIGTEDRLRFARKVLQPVSDPSALFADLYGVILSEPGARNPFAVFGEGKLNNVKIEGKLAMGMISGAGGGEGVRMVFSKQGEGWRIDIIEAEKLEMQRMPPPGFHHQ